MILSERLNYNLLHFVLTVSFPSSYFL
jgi:hypothetical protein